jgi:hypothetical protein
MDSVPGTLLFIAIFAILPIFGWLAIRILQFICKWK